MCSLAFAVAPFTAAGAAAESRKEGAVCVCTTEHHSATKKKDRTPFAVTWVDLEIVIMSKARQRKTNI